MNDSFPLRTWGTVSKAPAQRSQVKKIRIDPAAVAGFLVITEEPTGVFDVWVETREEVVDFLDRFTIEWQSGS